MKSRISRIVGWQLQAAAVAMLAASAVQADVTILPVGDSITEGVLGLPSYREEVVARLQDSGCAPVTRGSRPNVNDPWPHEGYSGHRAESFLNGQGPNPGIAVTLELFSPPSNQVDAVLLHIGTNDVIRQQSLTSTLDEIDDIIDIIKNESPSSKIFLANTVPMYLLFDTSGDNRLDAGTDSDGDGFLDVPNTESDALAAGIEAAYASDTEVIVVDVRTGFRPTDMIIRANQTVSDGVHPDKEVIDPPGTFQGNPRPDRSDSGEHHVAVAFVAALEAEGLCVPTTADNSVPLTNILSPVSGEVISGPVTVSGRATDTGGSGGFNEVRLAILDGKWNNFPANCSGCTWWDFNAQQFGNFREIDAHLFDTSDNYTQWRAGAGVGDPGDAGLQINLPAGDYTLFALAVDEDGNENYFNFELWPERTVFTVSASGPTVAMCNGLPVTVDIGAGGTPTQGNDVILGTSGADVIAALGGDDTICGEGGDDVINSGAGNDWVDAGAGDDQIFGLAGDDTLFGGPDADVIVSGVGADIIEGNDGNDVLNGGPDDDLITGGNGDDDLFGQGGDDFIFGGSGNDFILGVDGEDEIAGGPGNDVLNGGPGNDTINGNSGDDTVFGLSGDDILHGGVNNDQVFGQLGNDTITGGTGDDGLFGNQGDDVISDSSGANVINGGPDDDTLTGGSGVDQIFGDGTLLQAGNDVINGGGGADLLLGFAGNDTITSNDGVADTVNGGPGADTCTTDGVDVVFNCP